MRNRARACWNRIDFPDFAAKENFDEVLVTLRDELAGSIQDISEEEKQGLAYVAEIVRLYEEQLNREIVEQLVERAARHLGLIEEETQRSTIRPADPILELPGLHNRISATWPAVVATLPELIPEGLEEEDSRSLKKCIAVLLPSDFFPGALGEKLDLKLNELPALSRAGLGRAPRIE